jgi:antitoxin (DNA-binding transcriptional repressor) of toxin-antitoxin stability system
MQTATIDEVQARLPELLERLSPGDELVIVRDGKPVARLAPVPLPTGVPILDRGKGKLIQYIDDDEHLKDFADYMP